MVTPSEKYIICGHTHSQGLVYDGEKKVINAGAVGVPLKSPQKTQYLILESVGKEWKSNYQSLEYDISNVIEDMHKSIRAMGYVTILVQDNRAFIVYG